MCTRQAQKRASVLDMTFEVDIRMPYYIWQMPGGAKGWLPQTWVSVPVAWSLEPKAGMLAEL